MEANIKNSKIIRYIVFFIIIIGCIVRIINLGKLPLGMSHDEAYAAYESYSMLNYGIDSHGYHNPVYLVVWGSGMSSLYSYLTMPFIYISGNQLIPAVTRLPQAIMGIITLLAFYLAAKRITNIKVAIIGLFLLTINPWHISLSRFGLDCNLAPAFIMLGLYFFILAMEKEKYLVVSMIFYGLSLYCYATIWIIIPFILILQFAYAFYHKKIMLNKYFIISMIVIFILAMPLLLFLLINYGFISEIRTSILSIPKLTGMRESEISIRKIGENFSNIYNVLKNQTDGMNQNSIPGFGSYYLFSTPFIITGIVISIKENLLDIKNKKFNDSIFFVIQLILCFLLGLIITEVNINKINSIHIPIIFYNAYGIYIITKKIYKDLIYVLVFAYVFSFIGFLGSYNHEMKSYFNRGYEEAIDYALNISDKSIGVSDVNYSYILYYSKIPVKEFIKTVDYTNYPDPWLHVKSFGKFYMDVNTEDLQSDMVYVFNKDHNDQYTKKGFKVKEFNNFSVAYK